MLIGTALAGLAAGGLARVLGVRRARPEASDGLTDRVRTELERDGDIPARTVVVEARDGVLCLRGTLPDQRLVERAVERTRRVAGVGEVVNLLRVAGPRRGA